MDLYQKQYDTRQNTPAYWHNKSHDLFVSASTLWKAMQADNNLEVKYLRQSRRLENREPLKAGLFIYHLTVAELK
jgi:hypothetical protein